MSTARSLRRKIVPASAEIALVEARRPERLAKYAHRHVVGLGYAITRTPIEKGALGELPEGYRVKVLP